MVVFQLSFVRTRKVLLSSLILISSFTAFSQKTFTSVTDGPWPNQGNWDTGDGTPGNDGAPGLLDNVIVRHTITGNLSSVTNLTVESTGVIDGNGNQVISGNLVVDGTYTTATNLTLSGVNKTIGGGGIIYIPGNFDITVGAKTIVATNLIVSCGAFRIATGIIVTNQGTISIAAGIGVVSGTATWINAANSTLEAGGAGNAISNAVTLNALASGNTVRYTSGTNQNIKNTTYYNLEAAGTGNKTLPPVNLIVNGNIYISSTLVSAATTNLILHGNWVNDNAFTESTGTVTLSGTGPQNIVRSVGIETFNNLTVSKTSGLVTLGSDVEVAGTLNLNQGNVDTGPVNKLILGTGAGSIGTLFSPRSLTAGHIIGRFERWLNATATDYLFPIGTSSDYRPAMINFSNLTSGSLIAQFVETYPGDLSPRPLNDNGLDLYNTFRDGYWTLITNNSLSSSLYNLSLTGQGFNGFTIDPNTRLLTRANNVSAWSANGTPGTVTGSSVSRTDLTILSGEYTFADDDPCIPPGTPVITISNPNSTSICSNSTGQIFTVANNPPNTYTWSVIGGTITAGQTTNSITVDWGNTGIPGSVSVFETKAGCSSSPVATQSITLKPIAPDGIIGSFNVPQSQPTIPFVSKSTYAINSPEPGYSYNWTVTGGTFIIINATSIEVTWGSAGKGKICVAAQDIISGCSETSATFCKDVEIYSFIFSERNGNWTNPNTWTCNCVPQSSDNVIILATHTVILNTSPVTVRNFTIITNGVLTLGANTFTINRNLTLNGAINGSVGSTLNLNGPNALIEGNGGTIAANVTNVNMNSSASFGPSASLTRTGILNIAADRVITNYGNITVNGDIIGSNAGSTWVNSIGSVGSVLNVRGALLTTGTLDASSNDGTNRNTVNYTGNTAAVQNIKTPVSSQYANLSITGTGTGLKTPAPNSTINVSGNWVNSATGGFNANGGTINFNGTSSISGTTTTNFNNLSIAGSSTLTSTASTINVLGNFTNDGTFLHGNGTVNFNGTLNQNINGSSLTTFNNFTTTNKATQATSVILQSDIIVSGLLNLTAGNLDFSGKHLTLNGTFSGTVAANRNLVSNAASTLSIGGTGVLGTPLYFLSTGNILGTLTLNRSTSGLAELGSNLTVTSNIFLTNGELNNPLSNLTMGNNATINRKNLGLLTGTAALSGTPPTGNSYNLVYTGSVDFSTGLEAEGSHVKNMSINLTGATLAQSNALNLYGILGVNNGTYDPGNNLLTVKSWSDTEGAGIGPITGTLLGTKAIKVERYMSAKTPTVNRYVSSPVTGATLMDMINNPGPVDNSFTIVKDVAQNYDETISGNKNNGYKVVGMGTTLNSGTGYVIFPSPSFANTPITWDVNGPLTVGANQKDVTLTVSYTNTGLPTDDGWNLLGNPYPSAIKWDLIDRGDLNKLVDVVYVSVVQPNGSTVFRTWHPTFLGNLTDGYIAMGQAFWVRGKDDTSITIKESSKATSANAGTFYRQSESVAEVPILEVNLSRDGIEDASYLIIQPEATSAYDSKSEDAFKLEGDDIGISLLSDEGYRMVYYATSSAQAKNIELNIMANTPGDYGLNFREIRGERNFEGLYLIDRYLGASSPLLGNVHTFRVSKSEGTKNNRFYISSKPADEQVKEISLSAYPNPTSDILMVEMNSSVDVPVSLFSIEGCKVGEFKLLSFNGMAKGSIDLRDYSNGFYLIKAIIEGKVSALKVIKK